MLEKFSISTSSRIQLIDITEKIEGFIIKSRVKDGVALVYTPHTTSAITINENADPSVQYDINNFLSKLIPHLGGYTHLEGNSDSHIKSTLFGASEHLIISAGRLLLGTWQGVYFCEFDGPRSRNFYVKVIEG